MKFFNYCDENKRRNPVSEQYQTWLSLQDKGDEIGCSCQLSVSSESHGFASDIIQAKTHVITRLEVSHNLSTGTSPDCNVRDRQ